MLIDNPVKMVTMNMCVCVCLRHTDSKIHIEVQMADNGQTILKKNKKVETYLTW